VDTLRSGHPSPMRPTLKNSFLVFVAVLAAVNVGNYFVVSQAFEDVGRRNAAVRHTQQVMSSGNDFLRHMIDAETGQRGYLLTGNPDYLQPYTRGRAQALKSYARLMQLTQGNPTQQRRLQGIESAVLSKLAEMQETIELHDHGHHEHAVEVIKRNTGRRFMLEIRAQVAEFSGEEAQLLRLREEASTHAWNSAVRWYVATNLLVIALTLAAFGVLRTRVIGPVRELALRLTSFGEGVLPDAPVPVRAMHEVSVLMKAFAQMSASLRDKQQALQNAVQRAEAASQAMAESAREYADLYNQAPCGYHSLDAEGIVRRINDTELRWLGYTREEVVDKKHLTELLTAESATDFRAAFTRFMRDGVLSDLEANLLCKDGSTLPVLVNATGQFNERGELTMSRSVLLEHGRLRQERATLRNVLTAAPMAVRVATLRDNKVVFMNRSFCELVQRSEEEARDLDISKNYVDRTVFDDIRARLAAGEIILNRLVELHLPEQPDLPHVFALGSYMLIDYEGQRAVLAWLIDVTQLHAAKLTAEAADRRAQAQSQAKSDFLANMSHEIRSPLNAMLGLAYLLDQTALQPEQRSQLGKLRVAGQSLLGLINDVLDLAKIEAGELSVERAPFSLAKLLDEVYAVHVSAAEAKGLRLDVVNEIDAERETSARAAVLIGDAQHLRQVLLNLINNAIKFTERGSVQLTVQQLEVTDTVPVRARVLFQVRDTGIGIDPKVAPALFSRFTQADSSTTRRFGGTGLGLSIVKQLSEHMGGRVWLESTPGQGSCFFVELPFEVASEADRSALGLRATPLEVIIAEDDDTQRESLVSMAKNFGWRVEDVKDGAELVARVTVRAAEGRMPDCLIIDWRMPTLDGLQALQSLSMQLGPQQVPTAVVITAHELEQLKSSAYADLPDSVLVKRVSSSELFNAVNTAVIKRGGRRNLVLEGSLVDRAPVAWLPDVHVLLVDDSDLNLEVAGSILRRQGAVVSTANNGAAALEWLRDRSHRVDIVLMDVQMPVMDGNDAVREIRKHRELTKLPVVALTAGALLRERTKALAAGMNDYLTKPFEPENIVRVVRQQVEHARGAPLGTSARPQPGAQLAWPEIAGIDGPDVRARLSGNVEVFLSGLRRLLQDFGDWQTVPVLPRNDHERAAMSGRMHKLLGSSGVIGAREIANLARTLEQRLRAGQDSELHSLFEQLSPRLVALARAAAPHLDAADNAKRQLEAAQREQPQALDPDALLRLREQLAQNDFAVLGTFKELAPALRAALSEPAFRRIEQAIAALDFQAAIAALDAVQPGLSRPPSAAAR
jgi:PAS domain S-box-containing protein